MLWGYFDDSGTHDDAQIVLVGGICGTEAQLGSLERTWRAEIDSPMCGRKPRVRRFHAFECHNSLGTDYTGWTRTETDHFWHRLVSLIIDSGVTPYGVACVRQDWDDLIKGDVRQVYGNAEQMCIKNCFVKAVDWAERNSFDPKMTFVFDNRPSAVKKEAAVASHAFEHGRPNKLPQLVGTAFLNSFDILPLQAADLIAWELYQFANDIFSGETTMGRPRRMELQRLLKDIPGFQAQFATRQSIETIAQQVANLDQSKIAVLADHFRTFDPSAG